FRASVAHSPSQSYSFSLVDPLPIFTGVGNFIPPYAPPDENGQSDNATPFWMVGATGVEVEVDTETGRVKVTRLVNVADVGTPIKDRKRTRLNTRQRRTT